jgi:hypothetical protein
MMKNGWNVVVHNDQYGGVVYAKNIQEAKTIMS